MIEDVIAHGTLSAAQSGIWFAHSLDSSGSLNSIGDYLDIRGRIDPEIMALACARVERETEALRTWFTDAPDGPRQHVHPGPVAPLLRVDLAGEPDPAAAAQAWMAAEIARPVDLTRPGLCTVALLHLAEDRFLLYRRVHHSVFDGWGLALIHNRTAAVYSALAAGGSTGSDADEPFPPMHTLRDADTAYRGSRAFRRDRGYWLKRLADRPQPTQLAGWCAPVTGGVQRRWAAVDAEHASRLRAAAGRFGLSWAELAVAVTGAYVGRMSGAEDVLLGMPITTRVSRVQRAVPGMTANVVLVRLAVSPGTMLAEFAAHTRSEVRSAVLHGRYRPEDLARDLGPPGAGRPPWGPLVNVMDFDYDLRFGDAHATVRTVSRESTGDWAVTFFRTSGGGGFEIILDTNPGSYSAAEADAHLARFLHFLNAVAVAAPDTPLRHVPVLAHAATREPTSGPAAAAACAPPGADPARTPETRSQVRASAKHLRSEVRPGAFAAKLAAYAALTAAGGFLATRASPGQWIPGVLLLGCMFAHAAELQHQALHNLGFRRARANTVAGVLLGLPMLTSFAAYRVSHLRHHRDLGTPDNREFFDYGDQYGGHSGRSPAFVAFGWFLRFSMVLHYVQFARTLGRTVLWRNIPGETARTSRRIRRDYWIMLAAIAALAAVAALGDPWLALRLWLLPLVAVAAPVHALIELPEHFRCDTDTTDPFANTRTIRSTRLATWFTNGNNYHVEHHLMPNLPIERLPELHTLVRDQLHYFHPSYSDYFRTLLRGKAER